VLQGVENRRRESKEKAYFYNYAIGARGPKAKKRISELKIGFLNLPWLGNLHKEI
jgi:hypothetical protein